MTGKSESRFSVRNMRNKTKNVIKLSLEAAKGRPHEDKTGEGRAVTDIATRRFRALFISDVHLGTRGCQADKLLDFLRYHEADTIYLVGDIVDGWALRSSWYWPQPHNDVVQKLLRQARKGARLIYIPGNHDEFLRGYYGTHFGGIEVVQDTIHTGVDGKRYLVVHGDIFDLVVTQARWLALLGDKAYDFAIQANRFFNALRRIFGAPYWSLSKWAKMKVKNAVNYIGAFEKALATEAKHHHADGVICGHIHTAALHDDFGLRYINCGDWVESCTAVAENFDGSFEIITWTQSGDGTEQLPETDVDVGMDAIMNGMRQAAE
jgi:UDP-2,3-diacylglucosamine pyrophosphatase LpxH